MIGSWTRWLLRLVSGLCGLSSFCPASSDGLFLAIGAAIIVGAAQSYCACFVPVHVLCVKTSRAQMCPI
jgi:hypothetical protein